MIRNQWYGILDAKEVKTNTPVGVLRMGEKLVLWRTRDGKVHCLADKCCHRGASLSIGKVRKDNIRCPFHGFEYNSSGRVVQIPANGTNSLIPDHYRVQDYSVIEKYGFIWLWYGEPSENLPEIPFFEYLREGFNYGGFSETWSVHYTRAIENQLDVVHLPFVHFNSIGRGNKTLVNGPVVRWEENRMTFYVCNEVDTGKKIPLKPSEINDYEDLFSLQLQMPNLWQNRISKNVRIVALFAPIDEERTRIYIRFYQNFIKLPGLLHLVNLFSNVSNRYILHQDRKVVLTQLPVKTDLKMNENLIQGDLPIIEYRKRRAFLQGEVPTKK